MTPIPHICITFPIIIATHHERATFAAINEPTLINIIITKVHKVYIWIHSLKKKYYLFLTALDLQCSEWELRFIAAQGIPLPCLLLL